MEERILPLLCDPDTHDALALDTGGLLNSKSGRRYPIRDDIPVFFEALSGSNKKYQELYDRIACFYGLFRDEGELYTRQFKTRPGRIVSSMRARRTLPDRPRANLDHTRFGLVGGLQNIEARSIAIHRYRLRAAIRAQW